MTHSRHRNNGIASGGFQKRREIKISLTKDRRMKIGVTSQNFRTITAHAGKARRFMIFETAGGQAVETGRLDLSKEMSLHEHPCGAAHPIDDLDILISGSAGEGFIRKAAERGVKVILTSETDPAAAVAAVLAGAPLPPPAAEEEEDHGHGHGHGGCGCRCASKREAG
jgi:predicted Fe-Mo cluster-binding NifX family protein